MGFKTISISDEVYRRLKKAKDREGVSFTVLLEKVPLPGGMKKATPQEFLNRLDRRDPDFSVRPQPQLVWLELSPHPGPRTVGLTSAANTVPRRLFRRGSAEPMKVGGSFSCFGKIRNCRGIQHGIAACMCGSPADRYMGSASYSGTQ